VEILGFNEAKKVTHYKDILEVLARRYLEEAITS